MILIVAAILVVGIGIVMVVSYFFNNRCFNSYEIKSEIQSIEGVKNIDDLKTRIFGDKIFVDVEISVDPLLTVKEGHDIAENVHNKVENLNEKIKHCLVHVNPYNV